MRRQRSGPPVENWANVYGNCFPNGLIRNILVMMTSAMILMTVSNPHNSVKKTFSGKRRYKALQLRFCGCTVPEVAAAQVQRLCLRQDGDGGPDTTELTVHRTGETFGRYVAAHRQNCTCTHAATIFRVVAAFF